MAKKKFRHTADITESLEEQLKCIPGLRVSIEAALYEVELEIEFDESKDTRR